MKKGFKEILDTIDKYGGEATWSDIANNVQKQKSSKGKVMSMSTATITRRLKEGKEIGLIGETLRASNGKKVYTFYKER